MSILYTPTQLERGLRREFLVGFAGAVQRSLVGRIASLVPSDGDNEKYAWLGQSPQMEKVIDEIKFSGVSDTGYTLTNALYGAGIAVKRSDIINDKTGGIALRVRQLASVAARHANKLLINALIDGTSDSGYDGVSFFNNSHPARGDEGGTQDNLLAGTGTTTANVATDINSGFSTILGFTAENGEPYTEDVSRVAIVAPPGMRKAMLEALRAADISSTSNVQVDGVAFDLILSGRLSDANDWYFLDTSSPLMPLVYQEREPVKFEALESGDAAFTREEYKYKATWMGVAGYGAWQSALKFVNT